MINAHKNVLGIIDKTQLNIGDLSDSIGTNRRQPRYWEEKGCIKSVTDDEKDVRRYSFFMVGRCAQIKELLDEGYILIEACERTIKDGQKKKVFRGLIFDQSGNFTINITDKEHSYGETDLSARCEDREPSGIANKDGARYELR